VNQRRVAAEPKPGLVIRYDYVWAKVRDALGLDNAPSWIVVSEHNVDEWPNGGIATLPGRPGVFSYGFIPPGLFAQVKAKFLELYEKGRAGGVRR
jgi:hypothetical protein